MRLHRFFVSESLAGKSSFVINDKELLHQWKNVFRFQVGHRLILLDNSSHEFVVQIASLTNLSAEVEIISSKISDTTPQIELTLFAALVKKDNFEWIIEKGTEVGVSHFVPVLAERSEKKNFNKERALKIIQEATEQSGRAKLPDISDIKDLEEALGFCKENGIAKIIVMDPTGEEKLSKKVVGEIGGKNGGEGGGENKKVAVFIGPEGGWGSLELQVFKKNSAVVCTFGEAILRAETAAVVASATLLL